MKRLRSDSYGVPILLAVGLHLGIVLVGLFAVDFSDSTPQAPKRSPIVNATVVDISQTIIGKREAEEKATIKRQAVVAEKKKKEAEQKRKNDAKQKALDEKKKKIAQAKQAEIKAAEALKKSNESKRLAEQKRVEKETEQKRIAQEADKKRRTEKANEKERQRKELVRKAEVERLAEEERKRQEETVRLAEQQKREDEAAQAAAEEAQQRAAEEAQMVQSISSLINNRVTAVWNRPPSARNGMKTQLRIYFLPNGEVMNAQVTSSSGDALFDQRAVDAVYKIKKIEELADVDSYIFERNFRQVDLIFNPQDLRN